MKRVIKVLFLTTMVLTILTGSAPGEVKLVKGQIVYVPCYTSFISGVFYPVKATIFIHNTDPNNGIKIVRIDFYNTSGKLVEKYLPQPLNLGPVAATTISVKEPLNGEDGAGAHFLIQWQAEQKVVEPLIEAWFLFAEGTKGYSFTSPTRIIQEDVN